MKDPLTMTFNEFKSWLRDRLHLRGDATADIDLRREEAPYERPLTLWKSCPDEFRNDFKRSVEDLVEEAVKTPWELQPFHELSLLLEMAHFYEAVTPLERVAYSGTLLQSGGGGHLHMLVLRSLRALGWKGSPEFWNKQQTLIGKQWPGTVFAGLAGQGVAKAFRQLPQLAQDQQGMVQVLELFPGLMRKERLGIAELAKHSRSVLNDLNASAAKALEDWFKLQDCPLVSSEGKVADLDKYPRWKALEPLPPD